jgi:DNA-binding GntR family transcriptional regulator
MVAHSSSASRTLDKARLADRTTQIYQELRELIIRGGLAPGSRIIESEIATRLEVSRTLVRSALQRLRQEGYVVRSSAGKQARLSVAPLTKEDAREVFGIVGEVEGLGARWAAELEPGRRGALVAKMTELNAQLCEMARRVPADPREIFDLHTRFHWHYVAALEAPRLLAIHRAIKPQAERYRRLYSSAFAHDSQTSVDEHSTIIQRIEEGDADGAQRAVQVNWRNAAERLSQVIELVGERGSW